MKPEHTKLIIIWCLAILFLFALAPFAEAEEIYSSVIRIHVLANSDSEEDQAQKLQVRDSILAYADENLGAFSSKVEAEKELRAHLEKLRAIAENTVAESDTMYPVTISLEEEYYPTRDYDSLSLPAGKYLSLKIGIGNAEGHNWWCVLFPPVCLNSATDTEDALLDSGMSHENVRTVTHDGESYEVRFRTVELFAELKEKISTLF